VISLTLLWQKLHAPEHDDETVKESEQCPHGEFFIPLPYFVAET
jgi:hypothetical protein